MVAFSKPLEYFIRNVCGRIPCCPRSGRLLLAFALSVEHTPLLLRIRACQTLEIELRSICLKDSLKVPSGLTQAPETDDASRRAAEAFQPATVAVCSTIASSSVMEVGDAAATAWNFALIVQKKVAISARTP